MLKNKKGQSLAELGIFSSLILFAFSALISWGMMANYEQEMSMRTFRKSLYWAINNRDSSAVNQKIILKDKRIPDPQEVSMAGSSVPVGAGASAIWSAKLYLGRDWDDIEIPRVKYIINGEEYSFTTAAYGDKNTGCGLRYKKLQQPGSNGRHWYWKSVSCHSDDIQEGAVFDTNGDIFEETLTDVDRNTHWYDIFHYNDVEDIDYIDYSKGEINLLIDPPNDQGLLPSFEQETAKLFDLSGSSGGSSESGSVQEQFKRLIRTRNATLIIEDANPEDFSLEMTWESES